MADSSSAEGPNYLRRTIWLSVPAIGSLFAIYALPMLGPLLEDQRLILDSVQYVLIAAMSVLVLSPVTTVMALLALWRAITDNRYSRNQRIGATLLVVLAMGASVYPYLPIFFFRA